jgi:hypothetical protein
MTKKESDAKWRNSNRDKISEYNKKRRLEAKHIILNKYGKSCVHCGFDDIRALQIDHIEDNGAEERKSLGGQKVSGANFYLYLIKQGLPEGYQTLCANCNNIKQWDRVKRSQGVTLP